MQRPPPPLPPTSPPVLRASQKYLPAAPVVDLKSPCTFAPQLPLAAPCATPRHPPSNHQNSGVGLHPPCPMELLPPEIGRTHALQLLPVVALHGMVELHDAINAAFPHFQHISKTIDFKYPPLPAFSPKITPRPLSPRHLTLNPQIPPQQAAARARLS